MMVSVLAVMGRTVQMLLLDRGLLKVRINDLQGNYPPSVAFPQPLEDQSNPDRYCLPGEDEANQASTRVFTINHRPEEDKEGCKQFIWRAIAGETRGKVCCGPCAMCGKEMFGSVFNNLGEQRVRLAEEVERCDSKADQGCNRNARKRKQCHFYGNESWKAGKLEFSGSCEEFELWRATQLPA